MLRPRRRSPAISEGYGPVMGPGMCRKRSGLLDTTSERNQVMNLLSVTAIGQGQPSNFMESLFSINFLFSSTLWREIKN